MGARSPGRRAWERANAATDPADALRWLERAHRLLPDDDLVTVTLGAGRLRCADPAGAVALLRPFADTVPAAAAALAAALLALGEPADDALASALRAGAVTDDLAALVDRLGRPWCGLDADGALRTGGGTPTAVVDDGPFLHVRGPGLPFLGSPLPRHRLRTVAGFVAAYAGGLAGWAWCPGSGDRPVELRASGPGGAVALHADAPADAVADLPPLAQPRRFSLSAAACDALGEPVALTDRAGRPLLGSPVWRTRDLHPPPRTPARPDTRPRPVDVVIPVFGATDDALACLRTVLDTVPDDTAVHVVDDASPDPALPAALSAFADRRLRLHRHATNRGFPAAANTGLRAAAGRDVVLLNSDTAVFPGWLARLRAAAYSAPDIGTATPLTADGSVVSLATAAAAPDALDAAARAVNAGLVVDLPVGVGFCLFIRRDCLAAAGPLREDLFAQGYGEETEFCLRAARLGWRHVAAADVFVRHRGGASFGAGRAALRARNQAIIDRAYPGFAAAVAAFEAADPLREARRRVAAHRWAAERTGAAVILITHGGGGGVAELVAARADAFRRDGLRPVVLLPDGDGCRIDGWPDLRFRGADLPALADLLRDDRPTHVERHHLLGHDHAVLGLADRLGIPLDTWVHDASLFCPRIALIGRGRRYCGEPDLPGCVGCIEALGTNLDEPIGPAELRARSALDLARSRSVLVPSPTWRHRLRRPFPDVAPILHPLGNDRHLPPPTSPRAGDGPVAIAIVGAIGPEKGFDVLLACAADARARRLPLRFVVCGETEDDERLMAAGPVFVTGRYAPADAVPLIRAQGADLAFLPSIWPETWCFALTRIWEAGLPAVAFDLGAPADRIRDTGRGHLLPLGLPPARINDALHRLASASARLQPSRVSPPESTACQTPPAP